MLVSSTAVLSVSASCIDSCPTLVRLFQVQDNVESKGDTPTMNHESSNLGADALRKRVPFPAENTQSAPRSIDHARTQLELARLLQVVVAGNSSLLISDNSN